MKATHIHLVTHAKSQESTLILPFSFVLFNFFLTMSQGTWDLSSLTRHRTHIPCSGSTEPLLLDCQGIPLEFIFSFFYAFSTEQVNSFFEKCVSDPVFHFLKAFHNFALVWRPKFKLLMRNCEALPSSPAFSLPYSPHSLHRPFPLFLHVHPCPISGPLHLTLSLTIILFVYSPPITVWFSSFTPQLKSHLWVNFISIKKKKRHLMRVPWWLSG